MRLPRRSDWAKQMQHHLAAYYQSKGLTVSTRHPYILQNRSNWPQNIVDPSVVSHITNQMGSRHVAVHKYIHHGLSSQAFLFNILGPLVANQAWNELGYVLVSSGVPLTGKVVDAIFEFENRGVFSELTSQPTSVDLVVFTDEGPKVFIECKFTESEFGGCGQYANGDCDGSNPLGCLDKCYLQVVGRSYWARFNGLGLATSTLSQESRCPFMDLYQAYRLFMFARYHGGIFVLLHDARNTAFDGITPSGIRRGLFPRFLSGLPAGERQHCLAVTAQDVVKNLNLLVNATWVQEVRVKYQL